VIKKIELKKFKTLRMLANPSDAVARGLEVLLVVSRKSFLRLAGDFRRHARKVPRPSKGHNSDGVDVSVCLVDESS